MGVFSREITDQTAANSGKVSVRVCVALIWNENLPFNVNRVGTVQQFTCDLTEIYSGCRLFRVSYRPFTSQLL